MNTLFYSDFNAGASGFAYQDDIFDTSQPAYATGSHSATAGYEGGALLVTLGGVDENLVAGISGGWSYNLTLSAAATGVRLSFRYKLDQTATYEYDEYSQVRVSVAGVEYGRGQKSYVDQIGGDGASTQGNSSSYVPTTDWQLVEFHVGDLLAGVNTFTLGAYNNKKDNDDESTKLIIDEVKITSGNPNPVVSDALLLVKRADQAEFRSHIQGLAQFHDRCRGSGMGCSSTDYSTNYMNALAWVEGQLQSMGYTTQRHNFNYNGNTGTNLWATKIGSVIPTQMYMVSAHLDARSGGDGFDDDGSGAALVMEAARVFSGSDVSTDKSVRFIFWDKEELGLYGANGYVQDRRSLQGTLDEPTWLGLIQHDMILYDHGIGAPSSGQSPYADLDVEWRAGTTKAADSRTLAYKWRFLNGAYSTDYSATAYDYSTNTDDTPFHPYVAAVSVRENRRSLTSGVNAEWINPYYHTTNDVEASYSEADIRLGFNAVQATIGTVAELAGAHATRVNTPPSASSQSIETAEDGPVGLVLAGSDPDGDPITYRVTTPPDHGSLSGTPPNLNYTPAADYSGEDAFQFVVNDGQVDSIPAEMHITIVPVNDAPDANAQSIVTDEDMSTTVVLSGSDIDGDELSYTLLSQPAHGIVAGTAPVLTYTPAADYAGVDLFAFKVNDGLVDSDPVDISIVVSAVNDPPLAYDRAVSTTQETAVPVTLTGSDVEGGSLTYAIGSEPQHGTLTGSPPVLTYLPEAGYSGSDTFTFTADDGDLVSAPATISIVVNAGGALPLPFADDFETTTGWQVDSAGTDSARLGRWAQANPEATDENGPKQLDATPSGEFALVTGAAGGRATDTDVDGGLTSVTSPLIQLAPGEHLKLSLQYTFAHGRNSSANDFLRVKVVGASEVTVLEVSGSNADVDAAWTPFEVSLDSFAGQAVRVKIEAADFDAPSLVEAAVDDVSISAVPVASLLSADFDAGTDGFTYSVDSFRGTNQPEYASGDHKAAGGLSGGSLSVRHGGIDNSVVEGMSSGWRGSFALSSPGPVTISFWFNLTQSAFYEREEVSQVMLSVDGVIYGAGANDYVAQIEGNGNGGIEETTGWRLFSLTTESLAQGTHTIILGTWGSGKSHRNEKTDVLFDMLRVAN